MSTNKGFSVASVILSYFLVAGGLTIAVLVGGVIKINSAVVLYVLIAAGAFGGGFLAARASAGSTIIEPVIGALLLVATLVGGLKLTPIGQFVPVASQGVGIFAGLLAGGALVGAFLSEKLMGESAQSSAPWLFYSAVSALGATIVGLILAMLLMMRGDMAGSGDKMALVMVIGVAVGCLLSGLAVGSSALERPILSNMIGTAIGVFALFLLAALGQGGDSAKAMAGGAIIAGGGAIVSTIGVALGWNIVGKNNA